MRISDWSSDVCSSDLVFAVDNSSVVKICLSESSAAHEAEVLKALAGIQHIPQILDCRAKTIRLWPLAKEILDISPENLMLFLQKGRSEERRVGQEWSVRVDLGGRRIINKKKHQ